MIGRLSLRIRFGCLAEGAAEMLYHGRFLDTFEYAISMLMEEDAVLQHIDCISGRAFALNRNFGSSIFSCLLTDNEAVKSINNFYGEVLSMCSPLNCDEPFVMQVFWNSNSIARKYYPHGHYVLCFRKDDSIFIHDPDGYPTLRLPIETANLASSAGIVKLKTPQSKTIDYKAILNKGLSQNRIAVPSEVSLTRTFLMYAIRNYLCQTNKVLTMLLEHAKASTDTCERIESLFANMLEIDANDHDALFRIDAEIWDAMEELCNSID